MNPKHEIVTHISVIGAIANQLNVLGETTNQSAFLTKIIYTIPSEYKYVLSTWDNVLAAEQIIVKLQSRLLKDELLSSKRAGPMMATHMPYTVAARRAVMELIVDGLPAKFAEPSDLFCKGCVLGKQHQIPFDNTHTSTISTTRRDVPQRFVYDEPSFVRRSKVFCVVQIWLQNLPFHLLHQEQVWHP